MSDTQESTDSIDVAYVANLARLHLSEEERCKFQGQLDHVVEYVKKMSQLDLDKVEPTSHAVNLRNVFRPDARAPGLDRETAIGNAPSTIEGQFRVPQIIE